MFQTIMAGVDKLIGIITGGIDVNDDTNAISHDESDEKKQS